MDIKAEIRLLRRYVALLTIVLALFLVGIISSKAHASFDTIDANEIRIHDANGTLRVALFGKDREPVAILNGKRFPGRSGPKSAGLMFYNDKGDEIGGLIFGNDPGGGQGQSLTFDAYHQDQLVQLWQDGNGKKHAGGLTVNQVPTEPLWVTSPAIDRLLKMPHGPARTAEWKRLSALGYFSQHRLELGTNEAQVSRIALDDAYGHPRLLISVAPDGTASIQFLGADGSVVKTISALSP